MQKKKIELFKQQLKHDFSEENIRSILPLIIEGIYKLIEGIYECNTEIEAQIYFDGLAEFQELLSFFCISTWPKPFPGIKKNCTRLRTFG